MGLGKMGITHSGLYIGMAEKTLDGTKVNAIYEPLSCPKMPQIMKSDPF